MSNLPPTNRTCIGVSWGSDTGVVSTAAANAVAPEAQLNSKTVAEIIKAPVVLANADGNRTPSLWLNIANDEFLLSDGAKNSTLRFPAQGMHGVINLLDVHTGKKTLRKELAQNEEGGFRCPCGTPCACRKIKIFDDDLIVNGEEENTDTPQEEGEVSADDELTNFKAMTVHTGAKDSKHSETQGKFSMFLEQAKKSLTMDAAGLMPKTSFTVEGEDDDGNPATQTEIRLPETTWECALGVCRIFRTIIKDSLTGGSGAGGSPNSAGNSKNFPAASAGGFVQENPAVIVVSVPRHRTNAFAAYSLLRLAWNDWCFKSAATPLPTQLKVVHDDVAAFAAVLPKEKMMFSTSSASLSDTNPDLALVVNWGAFQLTVSLMLHTIDPVLSTSEDAANKKPATFSKMICLASKTIDREIGGYFIDQKMTDMELLVTAKRKKMPNVDKSDRGYRKFLIAAERAKIILSSAQTTSIEIESAVEGMDFVDPSFTRSKLENVISAACRLPQKFTELMNSVFAEVAESSSSFLPLSSTSKKVNIGVIFAGGNLRIPLLQNYVRAHGNQALENFVKSALPAGYEVVNTGNGFGSNATADPQEICSVGACFLAQTGCLVDPLTVSSEKKRSAVFAKPQLPFLGCDVCLLPAGENGKPSGAVSVVLPAGSAVPCQRQIGESISSKNYAGILIVNRAAKTVVKVLFDGVSKGEERNMTLLFNVASDGILKVTDVSKDGDKVVELQLL